jgi:hypothetical protein
MYVCICHANELYVTEGVLASRSVVTRLPTELLGHEVEAPRDKVRRFKKLILCSNT